VVLKPMLLGGLRHALRIARRAHQLGRRIVVTTSLESAVGRAGAAHLAAAVLALGSQPAAGIATGRLVAEDAGNDPFAPKRGVVLFTSGTTGAPKAARLARDNLEANARAANEVLQVEARSRFLCVLPLFHVGGLGILFRCQLAGATVLLHERFDADAVARELRDGATHASLVASALARVLEQGAAFPPVIVAVG